VGSGRRWREIFGVFLVSGSTRSRYRDELLEAAASMARASCEIFTSDRAAGAAAILVTLGVFTFLGSWNDFMWPLIVLNGPGSVYAAIALATLSREHVQGQRADEWPARYSLYCRCWCLFLSLQRYYIRGILMASVQGVGLSRSKVRAPRRCWR